MFLWSFLNSCALNLLLVQSHQAEIIIETKASYSRKNIVTRVRVEPRSCGQNRRKNDAFAFTNTMPTIVVVLVEVYRISNHIYLIYCDAVYEIRFQRILNCIS